MLLRKESRILLGILLCLIGYSYADACSATASCENGATVSCSANGGGCTGVDGRGVVCDDGEYETYKLCSGGTVIKRKAKPEIEVAM
ncbi:hypothetical protein [Thermonema rossianum]|jgi:hypothetical protein|uniref:hypothetical protein n=1 Tax=Thermonema rossianum TaxID=55505 RepID=UPI0012F9D90B|nr:hypothetical protein [Thermonema rossianum]